MDNFKTEVKQMAGQKIVCSRSFIEIIENGNIQPDDEWGLFRLSDDGLWAYYEIGCEMAAGIMGLSIKNKSAVQEISRFKTREEAVKAKDELSPEEQHRTLLRSVKPKK
jgi:hypothetical protein